MFGRYTLMAFMVGFAGLTALPTASLAQATQIGWCRSDGLAGGNVTRTRGATGCNFFATRNAARNAAVAAAESAAAGQCPTPINTANAGARCTSAGTFFAPNVVLSIDVQQSAGQTAAERNATSLRKVGSAGICTFARVTAEREETNLNDRSCGAFIFRYARRTIFADAAASCGVICR